MLITYINTFTSVFEDKKSLKNLLKSMFVIFLLVDERIGSQIRIRSNDNGSGLCRPTKLT
jgi:hypothetical protein